ncbi:hypothetical protein MTO96_023652 [Rhipicephalus appendiculatus]
MTPPDLTISQAPGRRDPYRLNRGTAQAPSSAPADHHGLRPRVFGVHRSSGSTTSRRRGQALAAGSPSAFCIYPPRRAMAMLRIDSLIRLLYYYIMWEQFAPLMPQVALLDKLGFRTSGIAPGTVASWLLSLHKGVVPRRGWFATLQRWGKKGGVPSSIKIAFKTSVLCLLYLYDI